MKFARHLLVGGRCVDASGSAGQASVLVRVNALAVHALGIVTGKAGILEFDRGVSADGQAFFLAVVPVLPEPVFCTFGGNLKVQTATICIARTCLACWACGVLALKLCKHVGEQMWGENAWFASFTPIYTPNKVALQWRNMAEHDC